MMNLTEAYIRKIIREVLSESLMLEVSAVEKTKIMGKSNERVPFSSDLMKQAILQGREVGINFRSSNDKYEMPTVKSRIIHPVAIGTDKKGGLLVRGLHITGQSEKKARETGVRSAEVEAEKDGMNAWRLFRVDNIRSMWFTDRFFSDSIPGYNPNDTAMTSIIAVYNPGVAKKYQDELVSNSTSQNPKEPVTQNAEQPVANQQVVPEKPQIQNKTTTPTVANKDIEQMGYEEQPIQEKNKNVRNLFR